MSKIRVTTNKRTGKCKRCGKCCTGKIYLHGSREPKQSIRSIIKEKIDDGFVVLRYDESDTITHCAQFTMHVKCNSFKDGLCTRHDKAKPDFCAAFPFRPGQNLSKGCGFKWKKKSKWIKSL